MKHCPRCNGYSLATAVDAYGEHGDCWLCGFQQEPTIPLPYVTWNRERENNDPVETAGKIERAKEARWRNPEKVREYNRAYKARRRALRRAAALA